MSKNGVKINTEEIPKYDQKMLSETFFEACMKFYSEPKNMNAYKKWEEEQYEKSKCVI